MAIASSPITADYLIILTAIVAVTFAATEIYRRDFLFGETTLTPTITSLSPGIRAGRSIIEQSSLFPDVYSHSRHPKGRMPVYDGMKTAQQKVRSGKAAHIGHPCTRFVSSFEHLLKSDDLSTEEKEWAQEHIGSMTIDEFASELESNPELHYKSHFRPMSELLFSEDGTFRLEEVACRETTDAGLRKISALTGKPVPKEIFGNPVLQNPHNSCRDLNAETRDVIEKLYKRDYCIFGYDELPSESASCPQARMTKEALTQRYADCLAAEEQSIGSDLIVHVWKQ
ncbi:hypothetical protein HJC23_009062 [Cyclotella cryptica]|uniref:Uncharacterized protein n=1 Tax=Cyclotella cryptica TaxID=29204 RepID=A0ABD3QYM0_9STRA|eukprot:CCRYP_000670-RA/>CCRYP_000670-RA protein AED:0.38 eAED:0.38 QI:0/-1/0/1/-1/1/1/0/283